MDISLGPAPRRRGPLFPTELPGGDALGDRRRGRRPLRPAGEIFTDLCRRAGAKGNLVPDAFLAALAIESGSEWVTTDRDYARFPGLRWRHPLS